MGDCSIPFTYVPGTHFYTNSSDLSNTLRSLYSPKYFVSRIVKSLQRRPHKFLNYLDCTKYRMVLLSHFLTFLTKYIGVYFLNSAAFGYRQMATFDSEESNAKLQRVYNTYIGKSESGLESRAWVKLLKETKIIDNKSFTATDADLTFTKIKSKGMKGIDFEQFVQVGIYFGSLLFVRFLRTFRGSSLQYRKRRSTKTLCLV